MIAVLLSSSVKTTSSIFASLLVSVAGLASAPGSALAESTCPQPAVVLASDEVMPVTKANYADAETQTVFAKYIAKVAAETCTGGLGTIWNDGETATKTIIWRSTRGGTPPCGSTTRSPPISMVHGSGLSWSSNESARLIIADVLKSFF